MAISQNFPEEGPTLNLNFAGGKTLDPRVTFTRTSAGTCMDENGLIRVVPANEPRFDHRYVDGEIESLGLLVEEQRSNLFPTSEVFVSGWGGPGTTNTDTILNPYGVLGTVYYITGSERYRTFNATGYSTLAFSFFTKKRFGGLERDYTLIEIFQVSVGVGFLSTYTFRFNEDNPDTTYFKDVKREEYPNGWYRFSCRLIARPDYNGGVFSTSTRVDIEGGGSDNYVWGIQVEPANFATSYIPTEGSTVTRTADNASITGSNFTEWYNPSEGSIRLSYSFIGSNVDNTIFAINNTTQNEQIDSRWFSSGTGYRVRVGGVNQASYGLDDAPPIPYKKYKSSFGYKSNDFGMSINGSQTLVDNSGTIPTLESHLAQIEIGRRVNSATSRGNIILEQLTYYPTRLTNTQLQTLTR